MVETLHVVVVHAQPYARAWLAQLLGRPFVVHEASNGRDALNLLDHLRMDVLVLDAGVPVVGAGEVLESLRTRPVAGPPTIVLGGPEERAAVDRFLVPRRVVWIDEPVDPAMFRTVVAALVAGR